MTTEITEGVETDVADTEEVSEERVCTKCGKGGLVGNYRVHDECLSTPQSQARRARVERAGLQVLKKNQHRKFLRILEGTLDRDLLSAEAEVSAAFDDDEFADAPRKRAEKIAGLVAQSIYQAAK